MQMVKATGFSVSIDREALEVTHRKDRKKRPLHKAFRVPALLLLILYIYLPKKSTHE
jgi:hypothetical protein